MFEFLQIWSVGGKQRVMASRSVEIAKVLIAHFFWTRTCTLYILQFE